MEFQFTMEKRGTPLTVLVERLNRLAIHLAFFPLPGRLAHFFTKPSGEVIWILETTVPGDFCNPGLFFSEPSKSTLLSEFVQQGGQVEVGFPSDFSVEGT